MRPELARVHARPAVHAAVRGALGRRREHVWAVGRDGQAFVLRRHQQRRRCALASAEQQHARGPRRRLGQRPERRLGRWRRGRSVIRRAGATDVDRDRHRRRRPPRRFWGSGPNDVWAVGEAGTIVHYDGTAGRSHDRAPDGDTAHNSSASGAAALTTSGSSAREFSCTETRQAGGMSMQSRDPSCSASGAASRSRGRVGSDARTETRCLRRARRRTSRRRGRRRR